MVRKLIFLLVVLTSSMGFVPRAVAGMPEPVAISVVRDANGDLWSSSGAFTDSGSLVDERSFFAGSSSTFHTFRTYQGTDGAFVTRADVRILPSSDPDVLLVTGRWAVVSGTGAYANLHGAGTVNETFNTSVFVISGTWIGSVTI
jgi:hypothetical protein